MKEHTLPLEAFSAMGHGDTSLMCPSYHFLKVLGLAQGWQLEMVREQNPGYKDKEDRAEVSNGSNAGWLGFTCSVLPPSYVAFVRRVL